MCVCVLFIDMKELIFEPQNLPIFIGGVWVRHSGRITRQQAYHIFSVVSFASGGDGKSFFVPNGLSFENLNNRYTIDSFFCIFEIWEPF